MVPRLACGSFYAWLLLLWGSCAHGTLKNVPQGANTTGLATAVTHLPPAWLARGSGRFTEVNPSGTEAVFVGLGEVQQDLPLTSQQTSVQLSVASNHARLQLIRQFERYTAQLLNAYANVQTTEPSDADMLAQAKKLLCAAGLRGVSLTAQWVDAPAGRVAVLAHLNLTYVLDRLAVLPEVPAALRLFVQAHAAQVFSRKVGVVRHVCAAGL